MIRNIARPRWWQLYLTLPLLIGLFMVDHRLRISTGGHEAVQLGILAVVFGTIHLWLNTNSAAMANLDQNRYWDRIKVTPMMSRELEKATSEELPMFEFPGPEIKGLLGTEFEMDDVQPRPFPVREVLQEAKKD